MANDATIGYLTVVHQERTGWTGGLLVLNRGGRPLEFQCTLPVRPSRAHVILYGPSLRDHLIAEVIAPALVGRVRTKMSLVAVDQPESLRIEAGEDIPVVLVADAAEADEGPIDPDMLVGWPSTDFSGATIRYPAQAAERMDELVPQFTDLPDGAEPFERIREAIAEAHAQIARRQIQPQDQITGRAA